MDAGRWTIVSRATSRPRRPSQPYLRARVHVRCVCGAERTVWLEDLEQKQTHRAGAERSTGCASRRCKARFDASRDVRAMLTAWALAELEAMEEAARALRPEHRRRIQRIAREQYTARLHALDQYIASWLRAPPIEDDYDHAEGM